MNKIYYLYVILIIKLDYISKLNLLINIGLNLLLIR